MMGSPTWLANGSPATAVEIAAAMNSITSTSHAIATADHGRCWRGMPARPVTGRPIGRTLSTPARCTREVRQVGPGSCPICGMALESVEITAEAAPNHELADMTRRFWIGLALTVPVFVLEMGGHIPALACTS